MLVLTAGLTRNPRSTAFLASRPAPTITAGLEVFVQLVMAAITTEPFPTVTRSSSSCTSTPGARGASVTTGSLGSSASLTVPPSQSKRSTDLLGRGQIGRAHV